MSSLRLPIVRPETLENNTKVNEQVLDLQRKIDVISDTKPETRSQDVTGNDVAVPKELTQTRPAVAPATTTTTTPVSKKPRKGTPVKIATNLISLSANHNNGDIVPRDMTSAALSESVEEREGGREVLMLNGREFEIVRVGQGRWVSKNDYELQEALSPPTPSQVVTQSRKRRHSASDVTAE